MTVHDADQLRQAVKDHYGQAAEAAAAATQATCCAPAASSCCGPVEASTAFGMSLYDVSDRDSLPTAALLASLGCGNPTALAQLEPGQVVLDLGSGGGIDVILSARRVAPGGMAYGLDMTPQMHELALSNKAEAGVDNAEFLLGTMEDIPLPDASVDVIISNCVVNLASDKTVVLAEAARVLRAGGRLAISDIVLTRPLPEPLMDLVNRWTGCIAGALVNDDLRVKLGAAGFTDIEIETTRVYDRPAMVELTGSLDPDTIPRGLDVEETLDALDGVITSAFVRARKS